MTTAQDFIKLRSQPVLALSDFPAAGLRHHGTMNEAF